MSSSTGASSALVAAARQPGRRLAARLQRGVGWSVGNGSVCCGSVDVGRLFVPCWRMRRQRCGIGEAGCCLEATAPASSL